MADIARVDPEVEVQQTEWAIAIQNLCFSYPDCPQVLKELCLHVKRGERLGVIGGNGVGKTTLFLSLCGVLSPSEGSILVFGKPVVPGQFRPELGLVFQNPSDQLFSASVWEDVAFGPQNMGLSPEVIRQRVDAALALTGTQELAHRPPHHLSGGQKRMVAIASVLSMQPQVVAYDEPSANLDLKARRRLIQFLCQSPETILISSHDLELILEVCDRVVMIDAGRVVADGKPADLMGDAALMEAHGLEKPHSLLPH